jgi:putative NIF3 family GTP cyclohydrolase 1 type 2
VKLDEIVRELDAYFRVPDVRSDDWSETYDFVYPDAYWRDYAEPGYEGRWNGLMVPGGDELDRAVTCVFPSDRIVASLEPRTLLFSEHPIDNEDEAGFLPLARASFYHVHAPLDMHSEVSPSRLCAAGVGLRGLDEF